MSVPDPYRERKNKAATRKAEADAEKAAAEAAKARADAEKAAAEVEKAKADARTATANARKAEQEVADHDAPETANQRAAESRKKAAEAEKDAAAARTAQLAALIPDLGAVKESTLELKEGPPLWSTVLLGRAVKVAAAAVAATIPTEDKTKSRRILVTSEPELANADAAYRDVTTGLEQLSRAADKLLPEVDAEAVTTAAFTPVDAAAALASAVPEVLSLFAARRTVSTAAVTAADLAATTAVAGAIEAVAEETTVVHDDFRLVPNAEIYTKDSTVSEKRQQLVGKKIALANKKSEFTTRLEAAKAEVERLRKAEPPQPKELEDAERAVARNEGALADVVLRMGLIDSLVSAIDTFRSAIRTVPSGEHRSPLASAALHEALHGGSNAFTHALLVKAQPGTTQQVVDNRPLWLADTFTSSTDVSLSYALIETGTSGIVVSGTETAVATARGTIGGVPTISLDRTVGS